jgi:RHS repeat-associated protein
MRHRTGRRWHRSTYSKLTCALMTVTLALSVALIGPVPAVAHGSPAWGVPAAPAAGNSTPVRAVAATKPAGGYDSEHAQPLGGARSWPAGGTASVAVDRTAAGAARAAVGSGGAGTGRAGGLGVRVRMGATQGRGSGAVTADPPAATPSSVRVSVADRTVTTQAGVNGVLFTLVRGDGAAADGQVALDLDYSGFADAYGGNYGARLTLTQLPGCVLTTPQRPECQLRTPVSQVTNVAASQVVSAESLAVAGSGGTTFAATGAGASTVTAAGTTDVTSSRVPAGRAPKAVAQRSVGSTPVTAKAGGQVVYALAAATSSGAGTYAATSLLPAYGWTAGLSGGGFTYSIPLTMPPGLGGPTPDVTFRYSSALTDGRTGSTNPQASWLGEGWDYSPGYIEQSYRSCLDDGSSNADLCWFSDAVMTMMFGQHAGRLVKDNTTGKWHAESDDGSRLELLTDTSNGNGDVMGRYWKLTTLDGTQYFFGKNKRYAGDTQVTNSTQNVLVYGNNVGEPCHNTTHDYWSGCDMTMRWYLDYVVDAQGNSMTYFYKKYQGSYGNWNGGDVHVYDISVDLDHIDYGTRAGSEGSGSAPLQVAFSTPARCLLTFDQCFGHPENWPDTPWDQFCATTATSCTAHPAPTFWDPLRLDSVTTQRFNPASGAYATIDHWLVVSGFPATGETGVSPSMWFSWFNQTGQDGGSIVTPGMHFGGNNHGNMVANVNPYYNHVRMESIDTGAGTQTTVTYSPQECTLANMSGVPWDQIPKRCYPQWNGSTWNYYHKYVVTQVTDTDLTGGSPPETTSYAYSTVGSSTNVLWRFDPSDVTPQGTRSWTDFAGYSTVTVTHGATGGQQNTTRTLFYRGLNGDVTGTRGYDRVANITDSTGTTGPDSDGLRGRIREEQTLDGTTVLSKTVHTPTSVTTGFRSGSWADSNVTSRNTNETETDTATWLTAPGTFDWHKVTHQYDATYGLATTTTDYGDTGPSNTSNSTGDDVCTSTSYATPDTTKWLIDYPTQTVSTDCAATPTGTDYLSGTQTFYDGATSTATTPTQGLVTQETGLSAVSGTALTWTQRSRTGYDAYGRPTDAYDALDRHTTTAYTPATGGPLTGTTVTNPLGHVTTTTLDPGRGVALSVTDPNGKTTAEQYDPLGRLVKVFKPHTASALSYAVSSATQIFADITDTGTPVSLTGDDTHAQISLPFAFSFYGNAYSSAWLSSNGLMSFTGQSADSASVSLPDPNLPNAAIYPFWDDLQLDSQSAVTTKTTGTAPNRAFTIEWYQAYLFGRSSRVTFSVTLNENGSILFNYNAIDANGMDQGNAATVGIENATGTAAAQYAYHQTMLATNKALTFTPSSSPAITLPDIQYDYTFGSDTTPGNVATRTLTPQNTQNTSYTIYDGRTRPRQEQTPSSAQAGGRVVADTRYNDRGLVAATSTFYNSSPPSGSLAGFADTDVTQQTRTTYDQLGRPTVAARWSQNTLKWQTTTAYGGDRTTVTPPDGGATVSVTDVFDRNTSTNRYPTSAVTGTPETTTYAYDRLDRLTRVTDPAARPTSFAYDLLGRKVTTTDPDTGTSNATYDGAGQVTATVDARGQKVSHEYDALGRETTRWAGDIGTGTKLATFTYDTLAKGQSTSSTRWVSADQYTRSVDGYNDQYEPTGQTWSVPPSQVGLAGSYHLTLGYDAIGQLTTTGYPAGGGLPAEIVTQGYNSLGLPITLSGNTDAYVTATSYDNFADPSQRVYGSSGAAQLTRQYTYDPATLRPSTVTSLLPDTAHSGQFTTVQQDTYAYTPSGDITRITDGTDNQSQCYRYDGQHRLTDAYTAMDACAAVPALSAIAGSGKYPYWDSYTFDSSARRTQDVTRASAADVTTRTFHFPAAGVVPAHGATSIDYTGGITRTDAMSYDAAGNTGHRTINGVSTDFTFNSEDQYAGATIHATGGDQPTTNLNDADGTLLIRKDPGGTTLYAAGQEYRLSGGVVAATRYYHQGNTLVAVRTPAGKFWLTADQQESVNLTVNASTAAVQRRWYAPYGADRATQGVWPIDRGFLAKQTNPSTALVDDGAREYDANLGTFISPDPVDPRDPSDLDTYVYSGANPVTSSDPTGMCPGCDAQAQQVAPRPASQPQQLKRRPPGNAKPQPPRAQQHPAPVSQRQGVAPRPPRGQQHPASDSQRQGVAPPGTIDGVLGAAPFQGVAGIGVAPPPAPAPFPTCRLIFGSICNLVAAGGELAQAMGNDAQCDFGTGGIGCPEVEKALHDGFHKLGAMYCSIPPEYREVGGYASGTASGAAAAAGAEAAGEVGGVVIGGSVGGWIGAGAGAVVGGVIVAANLACAAGWGAESVGRALN